MADLHGQVNAPVDEPTEAVTWKAGTLVILKHNSKKRATVDYVFIDGSHFVGRYEGDTNQRTFRTSNFDTRPYGPISDSPCTEKES